MRNRGRVAYRNRRHQGNQMTDINDDDLFDLATKSGVFALFSESGYRMARAGDPLALDRLRRFAELARQDEREAFATRSSIATFREGDMWGICYRTTDKADADDVLAGLRARGSDK